MKELEIFLIKVKDIIAYTYSVEYNKQVRPYFPARKYPFEYKMLEYILKYTKNIYLGNIKRDTLEKELKQISMTPIGQKMINSLTFYSHKRGSSFDNKICKYTMFRLKIIASNLSEDSYKDAYRIKKKLFCMTESDRGLYAVLFAKNLDVYLNKIFMDILNLENLGWSSFYLKEDVSKFVQNVFDYFALFNIDLLPVISKGCELDMRHFDYIRFRNNKFIIQTIGAGNCTWVLGNNEKKVCILNILHDLIGDGKASHASKILKAAIKAGVITKPTYTQIKKEFPNIGNESGYNNQMLKKHRDEEIEPIMIFFKDV